MSARIAAEPLAPEHDEPQGEAPASDMLFGFWYRALLGRKVGRRKLVKVTLLDTALVLGRDSCGRAFALRDACPHKGMPLSYGWHDGDAIQCSFHGWTFDAQTGRCRFVPVCTAAQQAKVGKIRAGYVPCEERDGFIWVYLAEPTRAGRDEASSSPLPPLPALPLYSERYRHFDLSFEVRSSADHAVVSQMDPGYGPFVHRRSWVLARILFGALPAESGVDVEPIPLGFRDTNTTPVKERWLQKFAGADTVHYEADFTLPNLRIGRLRFGRFWLTGLVTVTPLTPTTCRIDHRWAWEAFYWMPLVATVLRVMFWLFFGPDRRALPKQAEGLGRIPRLTLVGDADRFTRWYYQLKRAYVDARRTGTDFVHPIWRPATLKWRNPVLADMQLRGNSSGSKAQLGRG